MNSNCVIFSHVWIKFDQEYKKDIIEYAIDHFKLHNPDCYVILSGHGDIEPTEAAKKCDHYIWTKLDRSEVGKGHPKLVKAALDHAKSIGFNVCLKQRADCVFACSNVHSYYSELMKDKKFLVTHDHGIIGDLCMFGDTDIFLEGWDISKWNPSVDGMVNFNNTLTRHEDLKVTTIKKMKWVYLDPYWETIISSSLKDSIMNNRFDYDKFLWLTKVSPRAQSYRCL